MYPEITELKEIKFLYDKYDGIPNILNSSDREEALRLIEIILNKLRNKESINDQTLIKNLTPEER